MTHRTSRFATLASFATLVLAACGGGDATSSAGTAAPAEVRIVAGNGQLAVAGSALDAPLAVKVVDEKGRALSGATVRWAVVEGGGAITPAAPSTDREGIARATWTVGTTAMAARATASVSGAGTATFEQTIIPGPVAALVASSKSLVLAPGDTVRLQAAASDRYGNRSAAAGTTWHSATPEVVAVDATGLLRAQAVGSGLVIGTAGALADTVRVLVTTSGGGACNGASPLTLRVGEVASFSGDAAAGLCLGGGEYTLVPFHSTLTTTSTLTLEATATGVVTPSAAVASAEGAAPLASVAGAAGPAYDRAFEARLREVQQQELRPLIPAARAARAQRPSLSVSGAAATTLAVNDIVSLNTQSNYACSRADTRAGRVVAVTQHAVIVADTANPAGGFTDAEYRGFGEAFDKDVYPLATQTFGAPSDIDRNGKVVIFYTKAVNELTPRNSASYVGGFFFDRDLFPKQDAERMQGCAGSNVAEMFYMLVPDPQGTVNGNVRTKSFVASKTVGTIAHELQHLVNSARRLYVNGASDFEDTWLNEGLAHVAEELMFYRLSGLGPRQGIDLAKVRSSSTVLNAFNEYSLANFGRYREFLRAPERNAAFAANDELSTRGATWAFLRYAADRLAGDDAQLWYRLVNAKTSGMTNLRAVLGAEPLEWLADWAVSEAASAAAGGVEARYQQSSWSYRSIFPAVATGGHPLLTRTLGDGVPTTVTLGGGGAAFLRVGVQGGTGAMRLRTPAGATLPATLKLSVVRTK